MAPVGDHPCFRLLGRANNFLLVRRYDAAGFIPTVVGTTTDGRWQTAAREADVIWLDAPVGPPRAPIS